ncbi:hypothetical protein ACFFLM_01590 [Deinococcus oregonensis]|uniref:Restriction endonuclease n=1 Tax=Deinococcus oregonensis TaxID=1805970 RepID=A0ABV6AWY8_9DEIO
MHDTEDRQYWFELGLQKEHAFVTQLAPMLGLDLQINPAKVGNPKAIDFVSGAAGEPALPADLKTQNTPFSTAGRMGKNPGRTVTFNLKDLLHYERLYPQAVIFFHVHWTTLSQSFGGQTYTVPPLNGVWQASVKQLRALVDQDDTQHAYQRRVNDTQGNAKASYLLSLDDLTLVGLLDGA